MRLRAAAGPLAVVLLAAGAAAAGSIDFLVPGVSLAAVDFEPGARVSYFIVSEAFGVADTSLVDLAVIEHAGGKVLLEVASSPWPRTDEETFTVRLRLDDRVRGIFSPEEFGGCVREILVRDGLEPFREPAEEEIEDLDIDRIFIRSREGGEERLLGEESVETPAGFFSCDKSETIDSVVRPVTIGGIQAERVESERTVLWRSATVPFWGLVRSRVERASTTKIPGGGGPAPRTSVTESILRESSRRPASR
ncbi:MAG: hypothetical protein JW876_03430 [Candidatus Krumholzibacteriota bacterium]|nr:hypothetical protein [Candidatus Krumholzibacteriota bacterium]